MSEIMDRVAKAIRDTAFEGGGSREIARAVIEAMREPTEEMRDAATHVEGVAEYFGEVWRAMIDEALR
jgi:hypothetical protein